MEKRSCHIIDNISGVYRNLLPDFFRKPFPLEDRATCDTCIMAADDTGRVGTEVHGTIHEYCIYHPDVKCCTYQPDLPNFLAGAILSSTEGELAEGRRRIEEKIGRGEGVTPQGILATKDASQEYSQLIDHTSGYGSDIGCPYFDKAEKNCTIWSFRQANCSAFFCKSVEGIAGQTFWQAMNFYLSSVEKLLAGHVLQALEPLEKNELWQDNKEAFYIRTYTALQEIGRDDFEKICGTQLDSLLDQVRRSYAEATRVTVPGKLMVSPDLQYEELPDSKCQCDTGHGKCILSSRLRAVLHFFDGKADNGEALNRMGKEENVRLAPSLLLRLYKNMILVPAVEGGDGKSQD